MNRLDLTLYLGGTRSGKSLRAETQAKQTNGPVLYVATATLQPDDPAMLERIRKHRARRPSTWQTLECPLHLADALTPFLLPEFAGATENALQAEISTKRTDESCSAEQIPVSGNHSASRQQVAGRSQKVSEYLPDCTPTVLLDCVTHWISNILFNLPDPEDLPALETAVQAEVNALISLMTRSNWCWILVSGETGLGGIAPDPISRNFADALGLANQLLAAHARQVFLVVAGRLLRLGEEASVPIR